MIAILYAFMAGNLIGSGVGGHALRLTSILENGIPIRDQWGRFLVAWGAIVIYGLAGVAALFQNPIALTVAIYGPVIGVTSVVMSGSKVDTFQKVLGLFQLIPFVTALAIAIITKFNLI